MTAHADYEARARDASSANLRRMPERATAGTRMCDRSTQGEAGSELLFLQNVAQLFERFLLQA